MLGNSRSWIVLFLLLILGVLAAESGGAQSGGRAPGKPAAGPTPCPPTWYTVPSPNGPEPDEYLMGVDAVSANDAWAVGNNGMIQHWDGTQWNVVPGPNLGNGSYFTRVEVIQPDDVWAVGGTCCSHATGNIIRWNGTTWTSVFSSLLGGVSDLAAINSDDVWAAASNSLLHWDGSTWSVDIREDYVTGLDAAASNDVWAVGPEVALHWDGNAWTSFPIPYPPGATERTLADVVVLPGGEAWAVGEWITFSSGPEDGGTFRHSFVVRWDGSQWNYMDTGQNASAGLTSVDALSSNDVWAVGNTGLVFGYNYLQRVLHWDGSAWSDFPTPPYHALTGVAIAGPDNVWAVGKLVNNPTANTSTLVRRYADPCQYPPPPTYTPGPPTSTPLPTTTATATPTPEPPRCPDERFTDVCPGDYFYQHVIDLDNLGIVSGYDTVPPCESSAHTPCFKPYNDATRAQIAKVIALAAGYSGPVSGQSFEDVGLGHTFYEYIEWIAERGIIVGYPCGGVGEPCVSPANLPYYRPGQPVSRGQLAKMANLAFGFDEPVSGQQFEDVAPGSTFYTFTQRLYERGIIAGYPCGQSGNEPCVPPDMRPYFRPGANISRGQIAKIVNLARAQSCVGIPPSVDVEITPSNCAVAGAEFTFVGSGFAAGEGVGIYVMDPNGQIIGAPFQVTADENGMTPPVDFATQPGFPIGTWTINMEGIVTHHEAVGYFRLISP